MALEGNYGASRPGAAFGAWASHLAKTALPKNKKEPAKAPFHKRPRRGAADTSTGRTTEGRE